MARKITRQQMCECFVEVYFNGKTQTEMATVYGVSPTTVSNNLKWFEMETYCEYARCGKDIKKICELYNMEEKHMRYVLNKAREKLRIII